MYIELHETDGLGIVSYDKHTMSELVATWQKTAAGRRFKPALPRSATRPTRRCSSRSTLRTRTYTSSALLTSTRTARRTHTPSPPASIGRSRGSARRRPRQDGPADHRRGTVASRDRAVGLCGDDVVVANHLGRQSREVADLLRQAGQVAQVAGPLRASRTPPPSSSCARPATGSPGASASCSGASRPAWSA